MLTQFSVSAENIFGKLSALNFNLFIQQSAENFVSIHGIYILASATSVVYTALI